MRLRKIWTKATAFAVVVALSATVPATAAPPPPPDRAPKVQQERSVPGHAVAVKPLPPNPMAAASAAPAKPVWPPAAKSEVDLAAGAALAAATPVRVAIAGQASKAGASQKVAVETFDQDTARKAGLAGTFMKIADAGGASGQAVSVQLDYSGFGQAYGGDYGSRLYLAEYPACVLSTPDKPACRAGKPVRSTNNARARTLTADVTVPAAKNGTVLGALAGNSGSGGTYGATDLAPSGSWSAGGPAGDFTYSVPVTTPTAPAGPGPQLAFGYSSGSVDGRTSATNSQASWVGDGWDLSAGGFIERTYVACANDTDGGNQGGTQTGDVCWKGEHYTVSIGGISGKLIKDKNTGALRPEVDDGSRIEHVGDAADGWNNDESWKVTTPDGTQYFLGLNRLPGWTAGKPETNSVFTMPVFGNHGGEPCNRAAFADSSCAQAYRWNVDLVVDPRGNAMTYYYGHETNFYKRGGVQGVNTSYVAAGQLARIEYGLRSGNLFAKPPAQVVFPTTQRCAVGDATCDVPWDRVCNAGEDCAGRYSPAFFSRVRLTKVLTQSLKQDGSGHSDVDSWNLRQEFPPTGDGQPRSLWLSGITRTGHVGGTLGLPEVQFIGLPMDNRVDAVDNYLPITRYRLTRVIGMAGAVTEASYAQHECVRDSLMPDPNRPDLNTMRCYPSWWTPQGNPDSILDWFHKYVVTSVVEDSRTGGPSLTQTYFEYLDDGERRGGAWHYDDNDEEKAENRTWSQWRGYARVRTAAGEIGKPQTVTEARYLRGMDGDTAHGGGVRDVWVTDTGGRVEDVEAVQGFTRETSLYSGGRVVSAEVNEPHLIKTADDGADTANIMRTKAATKRNLQENGTWRSTRSSTTFTGIGFPERVDNEGDTAVTGDESCSETKYLRNDAAWMLSYAHEVKSIAKRCASWPGGPDDVLSDVRSSYDGNAHGVAPIKGEVSESTRWIGGTEYQKVSSDDTDDYGRVTETVDVNGKKTVTAYQPENGNPTTIITTNPKGWSTKSTMDTTRGLPLTETGVNGELATMEYDPLGRLRKVWTPGWSKAAHPEQPTTEYLYEFRQDAPTVVTTKSLKENGTYAESYDLYDGLLRHRQSQTPALGGGRILTDSFYDSRGNPFKVNGGYYNAGAASKTLHGVFDVDVPNQTVTEYDDVGRPLETILKRRNEEMWRTKTRYAGDTTYTTPPNGDTPTAVFKDAHGRIVERRQYETPSETGSYGAGATFDAMTYRYNTKGQLDRVIDAQTNQWTYEYDHLGRKKADVDPDRGRSTYGYDEIDQLTSTADAEGRAITTTYDDLGRKTAVKQGTTTLAQWSYDTLRKGLLTSATRYVDGKAYTQQVDIYDDLNRPTQISMVIPGNEGKLAGTYTYNAGYSSVTGQLLSETIPAAGGLARENVMHTYNELGQPESTYGLNTYASEHLYSPYGESLRVTLGASPSKVWVRSEFTEGTRRLNNFEIERDSKTERQVADRTFEYDDGGNLTKIADLPAGGPADTQCFNYDSLRRMTSAWTRGDGDCKKTKSAQELGTTAPYWYDFTFDKIGNRKTQVQHTPTGDVTEEYSVPASGAQAVRPHAVDSVRKSVQGGSTSLNTYTYDKTGNTRTRTIGGNTQTLDWSAEGRVTTVTEADGKKSQYVYDAGGNRLLKKEPNGTATLYLPGQEVTLAAGASAPSAKRYYSHGGATVAMRLSGNGQVTYLLGDHHGTDEVAIRADNMFVERRYNDPYGNTRGTPPGSWPDDKGFVGGTSDGTGLTSVGAREYDSSTGRFTSVDPLIDFADPQQTHGYAYGNNSPATFSDPSGLSGCAGPDGVDCGNKWAKDQYDKTNPGWIAQFKGDRQKWRDNHKAWNTRHTQTVNEAHGQACSEMGMSRTACDQMQADAASNKGFWDVMKAELPDLLGDLTGLNDIRDCFTNFDLWACVSIIPWGRLLKLARSAGKVFSAVRKALRWEDRVNSARALMTKWRERADRLIRSGMAKLDDIRDQVRKSGGTGGCGIKRHSFPPGTRVLLADGSSKPIEQVAIGDVVVTQDPATGRTEPHKVVTTWVHDNEFDRTEVTLDTDGAAGSATATLTATDWHPVWVPDLKAWVPIGNLRAGSLLQTSAGTWVQATAARHYQGTGKVHDLTIEGVHNYHVLAGGVATLVHNCGDSPTDVSHLRDQADDLHAMIPEGGQKYRTTGVMHATSGHGDIDIAAVGANSNLTLVQRATVMDSGAIAISSSLPFHAEVKLVVAAKRLEVAPTAMAVNRPFCPLCSRFLQMQGATLTSPRTALWLPPGVG